MFSHLSFECVLLLLLLLLTESSEEAYVVELGQDAHLPCTYRLPASGSLVPVCWGKGVCPVFDCPDVVLRTDERNLTFITSGRYKLQRNFYKGDVSLTITNVTLADSGTYCCRVQFPGPMNDGKFNLVLVIRPSKVTAAPTAQGEWMAALPGMLTTQGCCSETETLGTLHDKNQTQTPTLANESQDSAAAARIGVFVGAGVCVGLALVLISGASILLWYSHRKKKIQNASLVTLANLPPSGLANAVAEGLRSEENVYTIEENIYETEDPEEQYCAVSEGRRA